MSKIKIVIAVIAVSGLVVGAAVIGSIQGHLDSNRNDSGYMNWDGYFADISGAKSLSIFREKQQSIGSPLVNMMASSSTTSYHTALYKTDSSGNISQVDFYSDESHRKHVSPTKDLFGIERVGDNMVMLLFASKSQHHGPQGMTDPEQYILRLDNGRIYALPEFNEVSGDAISEWGEPGIYTKYNYIGQINEKSLFYKLANGSGHKIEHLCTIEPDGDNLVVEEVFKAEGLSETAIMYKGGVVAIGYNPTGATYYNGTDPTQWVLYYSDGTIGKTDSTKMTVCDGYLCKSVTYENDYFPVSCERYTSGNGTTVVNYTEDESFRIASETEHQSQIYGYMDGDNYVVVKMIESSKMRKETLKRDLTVETEVVNVGTTIPNTNASDFKVRDTGQIYCGSHYYYSNTTVGKKVYERALPAVVAEENLFVLSETSVLRHNLRTNETVNASISGIVIFNNMVAVGDYIIVNGLNTNNNEIHIMIDSNGNQTITENEVKMGIIVLLPL